MPLLITRDSIYKVETACRVHPTYQSYFEEAPIYIDNRFIARIYHDIDAHKPLVNLTEAVLEIGEDGTYIMHVVGPRYDQSNISLSIELLKQSYTNCLHLALKEGISDIAFPLISAGGKGFPKALAFNIAKETIESFLLQHPQLHVTLVVYEDEMYQVARSYIEKVEAYLSETYQPEDNTVLYQNAVEHPYRIKENKVHSNKDSYSEDIEEDLDEIDDEVTENDSQKNSSFPRLHPNHKFNIIDRKRIIKELIEPKRNIMKRVSDISVSDTFARHLSIWLERKEMSDSSLYKRIAMSKQTFNKIINGKTERPSQKTVMLLAIGLELNLDETLDLMKIVGYTFSTSSKFELIVKYFIEERIYRLSEIEETLYNMTGQTLVNYY